MGNRTNLDALTNFPFIIKYSGYFNCHKDDNIIIYKYIFVIENFHYYSHLQRIYVCCAIRNEISNNNNKNYLSLMWIIYHYRSFTYTKNDKYFQINETSGLLLPHTRVIALTSSSAAISAKWRGGYIICHLHTGESSVCLHMFQDRKKIKFIIILIRHFNWNCIVINIVHVFLFHSVPNRSWNCFR